MVKKADKIFRKHGKIVQCQLFLSADDAALLQTGAGGAVALSENVINKIGYKHFLKPDLTAY